MQIFIAMALFIMTTTLLSAQLTIVEDGQPAATIVLPETTEFDHYVNRTDEAISTYLKARFPQSDEAHLNELRKAYDTYRAREAKRVGDEEELAVEELQAFIAKISGAELPVHRLQDGAPLPEGNLILLGAELARQQGFGDKLDQLHRDGILLSTRGNQLILAGRNARGTLYAAYDFLESLGCRWVMPGEFGEIYPETTTLTTSIDKMQNPSHSERYWWCTYGEGKAYARWTLRNKGNKVKPIEGQTIAQGHALSQPLKWAANRQEYADETQTITVKRWQHVPQEDGTRVRKQVDVEVKVLDDSYYAMSNGEPHRSVPNMSSPKVWDLYADYYRHVFSNVRPFDDYVSISAEDGLVVDERPASRKLESFEFDPFIGAFSATDRMWFFHRRFIDKVSETYPDRKYGVLVYANNMTPPRIEHVHEKMALIFAPLGICPLHDLHDPQCKTNRAYQDWFEAWMIQARAVGAETYYYDYDPIGYQWNHLMINPQWAIIGKNYPHFHRLGLDGHTTQGHDDWGSSAFSHWLMIRLYWTIDQDYKEVLRDYCDLRFGAAGPAVMEYLDVYEQRMETIPDYTSNEVWGNHLILDSDTRKLARAALAKAEQLVDTERARAHLQTVIDIQRTTDLFCDGIDIARATGDFKAAADHIRPAFDIRDKLNQIYSHFVQPHRTAMDTQTPFLAGGWYNKYLTWDKKIRSSAASVVLPRFMKVALDTGNMARGQGWHKPEISVDHLEDWDSTVVPDVKYQTQREVSAFFYRTEVEVPQSFAGKQQHVLYFPSLIARTMQIWINGEPVTFDHGDYKDTTWRGPLYFWYNYDHQQSYDITGYLKPGQRNTIAFRVFKSYDHAGSYDRIFLLADPPAQEE